MSGWIIQLAWSVGTSLVIIGITYGILKTRLNYIEKRSNKFECDADKLEEEISGIKQMLGKIEVKIEGLVNDVKDIKTKMRF